MRTVLKPILKAENVYEFHEEAWNTYPYCKTVVTNPSYMKDNFKVEIESMHRVGTPWSIKETQDYEILDIFRYEFQLGALQFLGHFSIGQFKLFETRTFRSFGFENFHFHTVEKSKGEKS